MTLRVSIFFIILTIAAAALLASHQRKPFPLLVDAKAHPAVMLVCNPVFVPDGKPVRKVQQV